MITSIVTPTNISALQARKRLGEIIDKAIYQDKSFVVERAGKPAVAIIPMSRYERMVKQETEDRETFFGMTGELRERFSGLSEYEIENLVTEAVAEVRAESSTTGKQR